MKRYTFIDGNNLALRASFGNSELRTTFGVLTGLHYGFMQSLTNIKRNYPEHDIVVFWDGKSKRRCEEAQAGIEAGIISTGYKANRPKEDLPQPILDFYAQAPVLKQAIDKLGIPQIKYDIFETDDLISSYCRLLGKDNEIVCVSSDQDYYQLLSENVKISKWSGGEETVITKESWMSENEIEPHQMVDCGAMCGDPGDGIIGISGLGEVGALKLIKKYNSWQNVVNNLKELYKEAREKFPDITGEEFERLRNIRTPAEEQNFKDGKEWKGKYDQIKPWMNFTAVALGFEDGRYKPSKELKAGIKVNLLILMFESRIKLAFSLKKMDDEIPDLPEIVPQAKDEKRIMEYLNYFEMHSLKEDIKILLT